MRAINPFINKVCSAPRLFVSLSVALSATRVCFGGGVASTRPASRSVESDKAFNAEVEAANSARAFDDRIRHLRTALARRPDNPRNIVAEFKLAVELTQRPYPPAIRGERWEEGRKILLHVVKTYRHMDYYTPDPTGGSDDPEMLVPRAAILLAAVDPGDERTHSRLAMDCLNDTYKKRVEDWKAPYVERRYNSFVDGGPLEESKRKSREAFYKKRQAAAAAGDVLNANDKILVESAVRHFVHSYGLEEGSPVPLNEIVRRYPETPMAKLATERLNASGKSSSSP
jgi:hypothetical protein